MVHAAKMAATPKTHLHDVFSAINPDNGGARMGPQAVDAMNIAMACPRFLGSALMSAKIPPTQAMGADAVIPLRNLKKRKLAQVGATAQHMVNIVYVTKEVNITGLLPKCSESGPHSIGAKT